MSWLLLPFSLLFRAVVWCRNLLFRFDILSRKKVACPVISVGNLSVGGTGKTPLVAHLTKWLQEQGVRPAILSRGYKGVYKEESVLVDVDHPQSEIYFGDEPAWFAKTLSVPVYVGAKRVVSAEKALREHPETQLFIMDDGFQHQWLHRDHDFVLIDSTDDQLSLLPAGRYREPLSSLCRADRVFLTKWNLIEESVQKKWQALLEKQGFSQKKKNLHFVSYINGGLYQVSGEENLPAPRRVVVATSIARGESVLPVLGAQVDAKDRYCKRDHANWSHQDLETLSNKVAHQKLDGVVVTEKDWIKLSQLMKDWQGSSLNIWVLPLEIRLQPELEPFL